MSNKIHFKGKQSPVSVIRAHRPQSRHRQPKGPLRLDDTEHTESAGSAEAGCPFGGMLSYLEMSYLEKVSGAYCWR